MSQKERDALKRLLLQKIYDEGTRIQAEPPEKDADTIAIFHMTNWAEEALALYPDEKPAIRDKRRETILHLRRFLRLSNPPAPPEAVRRWRCEKHPDYISPDHHKPVWHSGPTGGNYCEGPFVVEDSGSAGGGA
jgi:hypothetical protein